MRIPVNSLFEQLQTMTGSLPDGTQIAMSTSNKGQTFYAGWVKNAKGIATIDNKSSIFETGSVTKAFTGNILAQLVMEGRLQLDDPIEKHLPFSILHKRTITFRQLAQHTSGLPRLPADFESVTGYNSTNPYQHYGEAQLRHYLAEKLEPGKDPPGEKFGYSNLGYGLLSYLLSLVEDMPFKEIVSKRIFQPLQMSSSSFDQPAIASKLVKGLDENGNETSNWSGCVHSGAIGILSSLEDLTRFTLMSADSHNAAANLQATETYSVDPEFKSGLGWGLRRAQSPNTTLQGINGGTAGYGATILLNREHGCAVTVLSNIFPNRYMETIYPLLKKGFTADL